MCKGKLSFQNLPSVIKVRQWRDFRLYHYCRIQECFHLIEFRCVHFKFHLKVVTDHPHSLLSSITFVYTEKKHGQRGPCLADNVVGPHSLPQRSRGIVVSDVMVVCPSFSICLIHSTFKHSTQKKNLYQGLKIFLWNLRQLTTFVPVVPGNLRSSLGERFAKTLKATVQI